MQSKARIVLQRHLLMQKNARGCLCWRYTMTFVVANADELEKKRKSRGWKVQDLCQQARVSRSTYLLIRKGEAVKEEMIVSFANAVGLNVIFNRDHEVATLTCDIGNQPQQHPINGSWEGEFTLLLSRVAMLKDEKGDPLEDENEPVDGEIVVVNKEGDASMSFRSRRGNRKVYLPISGRLIDGEYYIFEYERELSPQFKRAGVGMVKLNASESGLTLTGSLASRDPELNGEVIPILLDLKKRDGTTGNTKSSKNQN